MYDLMFIVMYYSLDEHYLAEIKAINHIILKAVIIFYI